MGFCPDGPDCPRRHIRRIICPLYITGFCPKGPECEFTHPRFEGVVGRLRIGEDKEKEDDTKDKEIEKR